MRMFATKDLAEAGIVMTTEEARRLAVALARARGRLLGALSRVGADPLTRTVYDDREAVELRAQLAALDGFLRCLCEAHDLPPPL